MPKPSFNLSPQALNRIVQNLKIGISKVESPRKGYQAINEQSNALGKYQFVPKYWWKEITKFGKANGFKADNYEDFINSPAFQESYFEHYVKNDILPKAMEVYDSGKNPENLSLEEMTMFYHFQSPEVAKRAITQGKSAYRKSTEKGVDGATVDNVAMQKYLDTYNSALSEKGLDKIDVTKDVMARSKRGDVLTEAEKKIVKTIDQRKSDYVKRDSAISNMDVDTKTKELARRELYQEISNNGDVEIFNDYIKEQNSQKEKDKALSKSGREKSNLDKDLESWKNRSKNKNDKNIFPKTVTESTAVGKNKSSTQLKVNQEDYTPRTLINPSEFPPQAKQTVVEDVPADKSTSETSAAKTGDETTSSKIKVSENNKGLTSDILDARLNAPEPSGLGYDKKNFNPMLPLDAVSGMAMGLIGNKMASEVDIPLREEQVSEAVKNLTAELARRSKIGLPPEKEAQMANNITEAYDGGLRNIVNASAGNRATILGNQGMLEVAKTRGIIDMEIADYEAKEKAFQQYGEAVKYINDFDTNRDVANHGIKYQEAMLKRNRGEQVANAGFASMINDLQYARENGPGSANHMYKSYLMQDMFGFDPNMKDDGSGTKKGTRSHYEKNIGILADEKMQAEKFDKRFRNLNSTQQSVVDNLMANGSRDFGNAEKMIDFMQQNPEIDLASINMDNIDLAKQTGNYGLLAMSREEALAGGKRPVEEVASTLPQPKPFTDEPLQLNLPPSPQLQRATVNPVTLPMNGLAQPELKAETMPQPNSPQNRGVAPQLATPGIAPPGLASGLENQIASMNDYYKTQ